MTSSESSFAHRAALFYGSAMAKLSRPERLDLLRAHVVREENIDRQERAAHKASCPQCQSGGDDPFCCMEALRSTPVQRERHDRIQFVRALIHSEERDADYARQAREHPVEYKNHIDGFCSYWQNVRHRKFVSVDWKCERCGDNGPLDAHHLHYDTLGFEELRDLQALCRVCHERADRVREASTQYSNAMYTYMEKKYGDGYYWSESAEEEFDRWLDRKERGDW